MRISSLDPSDNGRGAAPETEISVRQVRRLKGRVEDPDGERVPRSEIHQGEAKFTLAPGETVTVPLQTTTAADPEPKDVGWRSTLHLLTPQG